MIYMVIASFAVLVIWNFYLMWHISKLTNKLMSRNYSEYAQAESFLKSRPENEVVEEPDSGYDNQKTREINGIFGMGS